MEGELRVSVITMIRAPRFDQNYNQLSEAAGQFAIHYRAAQIGDRLSNIQQKRRFDSSLAGAYLKEPRKRDCACGPRT